MYFVAEKKDVLRSGSEAAVPDDEEDEHVDRMEWLDDLSYLDQYLSVNRSTSN
jgi:hypothetical protein